MQAVCEKITITADSSFSCFVGRTKAFPFHWHFHPEYELTLLVHGRGRRFVGDDIANFHDGDLVLLGPNLPHTWASEAAVSADGADSVAVIVQFGHDFLGERFIESPELRPVFRLLQRANRGLQITGKTRADIAGTLMSLPDLAGLPRVLKLIEVLDLVAHSLEVRPLASTGFVPSLREDDSARVDRVCRHIHAHLSEPISLTEAANLMHMTPRTFRRFFKRALGQTLLEYVNGCRIGHVCSQLISTDRTISEICYDSGFNNLAHFNRKFRKLKGATPREYRRSFAG